MQNFFLSADFLWADAIRTVESHGIDRPSRNGPMREVLNFSATLLSTDFCFVHNPVRTLDPTYAAAEISWFFSGESSGERILPYAPHYTRWLDNGESNGVYGARWKAQLRWLIRLLKEQPDTRQAVLMCWDWGGKFDLRSAVEKTYKDIPCTVCLQFFLRDQELHVISTTRSNDMWLGMPYDMFSFMVLQKTIACILGVKTGSYTHNVGSLHWYKKDEERLLKAAANTPSIDMCKNDQCPEVTPVLFSWPCVDMEYLPTAEKIYRVSRLHWNPVLNSEVGKSQSLLVSLLGLTARKWDATNRAAIDNDIHPYFLDAVKRIEAKAELK